MIPVIKRRACGTSSKAATARSVSIVRPVRSGTAIPNWRSNPPPRGGWRRPEGMGRRTGVAGGVAVARRVWTYVGGRAGNKPPPAEKAAITVACEKLVAEVLRPRFLPEIRPLARFNYPVAIDGKPPAIARASWPEPPPSMAPTAFAGPASAWQAVWPPGEWSLWPSGRPQNLPRRP